MGTRSVIKFYENGVFLWAVYQQFDGYLSGVGKDLKEFIKSKQWVNGFQNNNQFNGMGCFVSQFISNFKSGTGGLYIIPEKECADYGYNYRVDFVDGKIELSCDYEPESDDEDDIEEGYPYNETIELSDIQNKTTGEQE